MEEEVVKLINSLPFELRNVISENACENLNVDLFLFGDRLQDVIEGFKYFHINSLFIDLCKNFIDY